MFRRPAAQVTMASADRRVQSREALCNGAGRIQPTASRFWRRKRWSRIAAASAHAESRSDKAAQRLISASASSAPFGFR